MAGGFYLPTEKAQKRLLNVYHKARNASQVLAWARRQHAPDALELVCAGTASSPWLVCPELTFPARHTPRGRLTGTAAVQVPL